MLYIYEFEVFEDEGVFLAFPYDFEGGTQGKDFGDACESAADWLHSEAEARLINGVDFPEATFGNEPQNGGRTVIVAVDASKESIRKTSAAKAAKMLGVTPGRVSQMIAAGKLEAFKDDDGVHTWVTLNSIEARLAENPGPGRPKTKKPEAVKA